MNSLHGFDKRLAIGEKYVKEKYDESFCFSQSEKEKIADILKEHSTWYAKDFRKSTGIIGYLEDENIHKPIYGNDCSKKTVESPQEKSVFDLVKEHLEVW